MESNESSNDNDSLPHHSDIGVSINIINSKVIQLTFVNSCTMNNYSLQSPLPCMLYGEPLLKRSSSHSLLPQSTTILLVVWSANSDGSALTSKASSKVNLLNNDTL